jgi:uncharacterized membrane protein
MIRETVKGAVLATAVLSLFAAGAARADHHQAEKTKDAPKVVHCGGLNACKGHGACAGADNACKAQNACKGQGWIETKSEKECTDKGGKVLAQK